MAFLFIGIFICMQTPIDYLRARGGELGVDTASEFFWATGLLSSFLDNAPTYVVYFNTASALTENLLSWEAVQLVVLPVATGGIREIFLLGISLGAVFMGANTYIGNGPNFMVKTIAEQSGVRMPSFFGYMVYSGLILMPLFVVVMFIFLR